LQLLGTLGRLFETEGAAEVRAAFARLGLRFSSLDGLLVDSHGLDRLRTRVAAGWVDRHGLDEHVAADRSRWTRRRLSDAVDVVPSGRKSSERAGLHRSPDDVFLQVGEQVLEEVSGHVEAVGVCAAVARLLGLLRLGNGKLDERHWLAKFDFV